MIRKFNIIISIFLFSCQTDRTDKSLVKSDSIVIKQSVLQKDTKEFTICGTAMGDIISEQKELNRDQAFPIFWQSFYQNIVDKNYKALMKQTLFPLQSKYEPDSDVIGLIEKKHFKNLFSHFLNDEVIKSRQVRYNRIIEFKEAPYVSKTDSIVTIEDMVFQRLDNKWYLSIIYN